MKYLTFFPLIIFVGIFILLGTSCATYHGNEQWERDQTRFEQEVKHYPDRESTTQEKASAEAARKAGLPTK